MADYLSIPISEVARYRKENVVMLAESGKSDFSNILVTDPIKKYALEAIYYDLTPEEKIVYEYINGKAGKKQIGSTGEIAKLSGMTPSKVSRIKKRIAKKIEVYL